ncbi:hypothetical protein EVB78_157 [Rhizobium phage RHph_N1_15]|nr:hypothetical protein EVB77_157 [Rhizobium phage RHph_N1_10]QIG69359.1 hypothetical protein EVB78_157 [Rhizobium phage RHph_N1_15]QIG75219.1 hypothetical protein EVC15_157 [Rhizobium phage RHph_N2_6]
MSTVKIRFRNSEATPEEIEFEVSKAAVPPMMAWYGAFHAGDDYSVYVDGVEVEKDENGELVGRLIDV